MEELIITLIKTFGLLGLFLFVLIDILVLHQERGEKLAGWLAGLISWTGIKAKKVATAKEVQGMVDSFILSVNTEVASLLPYKIKIKYIAADTKRDSFIEKDRVVVMLTHHKNRDINLSRATLLYMKKAVIPEARPHIDKKLGRAIDLMMTKKALFSFAEAKSSLGHFVNETLRPQVDKDDSLKKYCTIIESVDERGLFTRVLLRELLDLGRKKGGITETGDTVHESNQFVKFLDEIARKEKNEDVPLTFSSSNIRIKIILVAKPEKMYITPFHKQFKKAIKENFHVVYIFARSKRNVKLAKLLTSKCDEDFQEAHLAHEEEFPTKVNGKNMMAYCAIFYNRKVL